MAAPFSALELIELVERAHTIYDKCRNAKADYKELTSHVDFLSQAIEEVKTFVETDGVPPDARKIASLQSARASCAAVLAEVEEFLTKYAGVNATDKRRYIDIAKFIYSDAEALKQKLIHCTSFLQLGLQSLNAYLRALVTGSGFAEKMLMKIHRLSMTKVQTTLDTILREYRTGKREPSVLSHANADNQVVERKQLMKQIELDLEDKNVHPDAILINGNLIDGWLTDTIYEGGFEETSEDRPSPVASRLNRNYSYQTTSPSLGTQDVDPYDAIGLGLDADIASPGSEIDMMETISRSGSACSHRSQPEDWHPQTRPDPEYVYAMLDGFFKRDFTKPPSPEETRLRIVRAFNQQDWSHRGNLTRPEVIQLSSQVLQRAGVRHQGDLVRKKVLAADRNRDGQLDKEEFVELMDELIQFSAQIRGSSINEQLDALAQSLQRDENERRDLSSNKTVLPWKWSKNEGEPIEYVDEITNNTTAMEPSGRPTRESFTIMALEADICVEKISDFKQQWLGIVPQSLQSEFLEALDAVYLAAIKFTNFESATDERQLSNFDAMITCWKIIAKKEREADVPEAITLMPQLEEARKSSLTLLWLVQGVCWRLLSFSTAEFESNAQSFPQFQKRWAKVSIGDFARQITRRFADEKDGWAPIQKTIDTCVKTRLLEKLEAGAMGTINSYMRTKQEELARLKATQWSGKLNSVKVHMPNVSRVLMGLVDDKRRFSVHIKVDDPAQEFKSSPEKGAQAVTWSIGKSISLYDYSCIEVSVYEQRGQSDVLFHKFPSVSPEEFGDKDKGFDFSKREPGDTKLKCNTDAFQWSMHVRMEDQRAAARDMVQLASCNWMDLLNDKETIVQVPDTPQTSSRRRASRMIPKSMSSGTSGISDAMSMISGSTGSTPSTANTTNTANTTSPETKSSTWGEMARKAGAGTTARFKTGMGKMKMPLKSN